MATMIEKVYLVHLNNGDKKPKIREVSEVFDRLHDNSDDESQYYNGWDDMWVSDLLNALNTTAPCLWPDVILIQREGRTKDMLDVKEFFREREK